MMNNSLYGTMRTRTFAEIWDTLDAFKTDFRASGLNVEDFTDESIKTLYFELYASFGNSHIASSDENQFKYKLYMIIANKGLIWQKNLEVQHKLRHLKDDEITRVGKYVNSHAYNPGQIGERVDDNGDTILDYINDQSTSKQSGSYLTALSAYMDTLADVSTAFIMEFKRLFVTIVNPEVPLWYMEDDN